MSHQRLSPAVRGVIVNNVETIYNIGLGTPLVTKFITVGGDVRQPLSVEVPIGMSLRGSDRPRPSESESVQTSPIWKTTVP